MTASKHKDNDEKLLWTISDTAIHLGVHTKTVSRLIDKGKLPSLRIGRCIRIPKQAVLDWVESQTRYNSGCVGTTCASTGEKPCQSLNVVMEEVEITTSMSDTDLEKRLNDLREHGTNG